MTSWLRAYLFSVLLLAATQAAHAQDYPNRPLRVVTSEVGAGGDFTARLVAQGLTAALGQPAVVDNRAGGSGAFGYSFDENFDRKA